MPSPTASFPTLELKEELPATTRDVPPSGFESSTVMGDTSTALSDGAPDRAMSSAGLNAPTAAGAAAGSRTAGKAPSGGAGGAAADSARVRQELTAGGALGLLGLDQLDWGEGTGGKIWECWRCDPCCGDPVNPQDALTCCLHFCVIGALTSMNWFARETKRPCAIFPHCLCYTCCGPCFGVMHRYNVRTNNGIKGNIVGDCCCIYCCGPCAQCQVLRSVPADRWKIIQPDPEIANKQLRLLN